MFIFKFNRENREKLFIMKKIEKSFLLDISLQKNHYFQTELKITY
jgi:hypothetical protein